MVQDIGDYSCSSSNNAIVSNTNLWNHCCANTDESPVTYCDLPGETSTGGNMNASPQYAIVVDAGPGIDDSPAADNRVGLNDRSRHDDRPGLQSGRRRNNG